MEEDFSPIIEKRKKKQQQSQSKSQDETVVLKESLPQTEDGGSGAGMSKSTFESQIENQHLEKPKRKFGLKPLTFFSALFDLVVGAVLGVLCGLLIEPLSSWIGSSGWTQLLAVIISPLIFAFFILGFGLAIMFVILGIFSLVSSFKSDKKNLNGLVITTIVFECILIPVILFLLFVANDTSYSAWFIAIIAILLVSVIFKIVDLVLLRRREKKYKQKVESFEKNNVTPNFDALGGQGTQKNEMSNQSKKESQSGDEEKQDETNDDNGQSGVDFSALQ